MSSLNDQVNARKRKLADIKNRHNKNDSATTTADKKTKIELVNRNYKSDGSTPANYEGSTVEALSQKIEQEALQDFKRTADKIISDFAKNEDHKNRKHKPLTNENETIKNMKRFLKEKLDKLDRNTDEEIKRIVRRNLMKDAV